MHNISHMVLAWLSPRSWTMIVIRLQTRRMVACVVLVVVACLGIYHLVTRDALLDFHDRVILRNIVDLGVRNGRKINYNSSHLACQHPVLEVKNPSIYHFFRQLDPIKCDEEPDWVVVRGSVASITHKAKKDHGGDVQCAFTELVWQDDDTNRRGLTTTTHDSFTLISSDFYFTVCTGRDGKTWENYMGGIRMDQDLHELNSWDRTPKDSLKLNVLIIGFDSLSRNTFIRTLPRTYEFLTQTLDAHVLEGYNIVGDGTPQALIPMLTGKTELELPESRKRMGDDAQYVNAFPFIWNNFKKNGYVTMFAEDQPHIGTFNYRLKGFSSPPTDHYMRPLYVSAYPEYNKHPNLCLRNTPRHQVFFDYVYNFMDVYKKNPKFGFAFHAELSHDDYNLVSAADQDFLSLLQRLQREGHLNNTLLILMSDHGHRFTAIRGTQQGKQEERLPFVSFVLPSSFRRQQPSASDNVRVNRHRLTTPFDLYPTLLDVLHFSGARLGQVSERGISVFSQIPSSRTCSDAYIELHWCACLTWETIETSHVRVQRAATSLVHYINTYTAPQRSWCSLINLHKIIWASKLLPNKGLLSYKRNADMDGFVPDMSDVTAVSEEMYQVHIVTLPGTAEFEASLTYNIRLDTFSVRMDDVSRTNKYGSQPHCIMNTHEHLRKFCFCRDPAPPLIIEET